MLISLILCSRNDSYMGNSRWRLETSINLSLINAKEANFLDKLEIIVSDWGSEVPLSEVLNLIPEAKGKVKYIQCCRTGNMRRSAFNHNNIPRHTTEHQLKQLCTAPDNIVKHGYTESYNE